jgi:hypothetical protein
MAHRNQTVILKANVSRNNSNGNHQSNSNENKSPPPRDQISQHSGNKIHNSQNHDKFCSYERNHDRDLRFSQNFGKSNQYSSPGRDQNYFSPNKRGWNQRSNFCYDRDRSHPRGYVHEGFHRKRPWVERNDGSVEERRKFTEEVKDLRAQRV